MGGCTKIEVMQKPRSTFSTETVWTDAILAVMLLVATGAGWSYYSQWWEKQKENLEKIDDDESQGSGAYHLDEHESDGEYVSGDGEGGDVNDSALNTSGEDNYDGYQGG